MRYRWLFVALAFLMGCNNNTNQQVNDQQPYQTENPLTAFDIEPFFGSVDSLQVLYFDDPYGDSIRYTRYFSFVNSNDSSFLGSLKDQLKQPFTLRASADTCRSEGKIYLLIKGEPVKTLYFSTRCPGCCYAYFIKDGNFYYLPLHTNFREALLGAGKLAQKP